MKMLEREKKNREAVEFINTHIWSAVAAADGGRSEHEYRVPVVLGYMINEPTPDSSTISYNFKHRCQEETVEKIFRWVLGEIASAGYLSADAVFVTRH